MEVKKIEKVLKGLEELKDYLIDSFIYMEEEGSKLLMSVNNTIKLIKRSL